MNNPVQRLAQYLGNTTPTHVAIVGTGRYAITADRGDGPIPEWFGFDSAEDAQIFVSYLQAREHHLPTRAHGNPLREALGYRQEPQPKNTRFTVVSMEPCTSIEHITRVLGGGAL